MTIHARARLSFEGVKNLNRWLFGFSHSSVPSWSTVPILVDGFLGNGTSGALPFNACILALLN